MPYAPGNQNNAAEYIAQAGNDVAAGIRQFQQNDLMRSTDISKFYSTAKDDTALVQFLKDPTKAPPAIAKIYEKLDSTGHLSVAEAAQLGSFTDLYTKNKVEQQTSAARDASTKLATAQGLQMGAQTAGITAANTQLGSDQTALKAAMAAPKDKFLNVYAQNGGSILGLKNLGFDVDAMLNGPKPVKRSMQEMQTVQNGVPGKLMVDDFGNAIIDPITGKPAFHPDAPVAGTPEQQAQIAEQIALSKNAVDFNQGVLDAANTSIRSLGAIKQAEGILDQMKAAGQDTGALAPLKSKAQALARSLGVDIGNPSSVQELEAAIGPMVIGDIKEVTSRMTNMELSAFTKFQANAANTPEANRAILAVKKAVNQRNVDEGKMVSDLQDKEVPEKTIRKRVNDYRLKNPIEIPDVAIVANVPRLLAAPTAQGQGGGGGGPLTAADEARRAELRAKLAAPAN